MNVLQDWVTDLPLMQQTVLLTAVRGPDGLPKYHPSKYLLRWYRRCILRSAFDQTVLIDPVDQRGGSFTGPSIIEDKLKTSGANRYHAGAWLRDSTYNGVGEWHSSWYGALDEWMTAYLRDIDAVPHHFQLHFMHGAEILGYQHPDSLVSCWWAEHVYYRLVRDLHLRPEPRNDMLERLSDYHQAWLDAGDVATVD